MEEDLAEEINHLGAACGRWRSQAQAQPRDNNHNNGRWSGLPTDVLYQVMRRLPSIHDCLSLAAVSHHWRSAVHLRLPRSLPKLCLALPCGSIFTFQAAGESSVLMHRKDLCGGSYRGATSSQLLSDTDSDSVYRLVNPFTGRERLLPVPSGIRVHEDDPAGHQEDYWSEEMPVRKLVVCPDGLVAAIVGHENFSKVALCRPESVWLWSLSALVPWLWYADMAFFHGKLYALTNDGDLLALEVGYHASSVPRISHVERVVEGASCHYVLQEYTRTRYLVVRPRGRGLLIVCRIMLEYGSTTYELAVFEADLGSSQWVQVNTLGGDEALFVGRLCSRVVRADRHGVRSDQIFFLDDSAGMEGPGLYLCDAFANVYDMKDGSVSEVLPTHSYGDGEVPTTWLFREDADAEE